MADIPQADPYAVAEIVEQLRPERRKRSHGEWKVIKRARTHNNPAERALEYEDILYEPPSSVGEKRSRDDDQRAGRRARARQNDAEAFDRDMAEAARDLAATVKTVARHHDEEKMRYAPEDIPAAAAPGTVKRSRAPALPRRRVKATRRLPVIEIKQVAPRRAHVASTSTDVDMPQVQQRPRKVVVEMTPRPKGKIARRAPPRVQRTIRKRPIRRATYAPKRRVVHKLRTTQRKSVTFTNAPGLRDWLERQSNLQHEIDLLISRGKIKEAEKLRLKLLKRQYNL